MEIIGAFSKEKVIPTFRYNTRRGFLGETRK